MRRNNPFAESPSDRLNRGAFAAWRKEGFLMSRRAKLLAFTLAMLGLLGVATAAQAGEQLFSGSLIVEAFGRDEGYNSSYPTPYFYAVPVGAYCNAMVPKGNYCGTATVQQGAPLTGMGTAVTDGKGGFTIPASGLNVTTRGSFQYYPPYIRSYSYATLKNQAGGFFGGGGPGNFSRPYTVNGVKVAKAAAKQGSKKFGGTMQLLGAVRTKGVYAQDVGLSIHSSNWGWDILGASAMGTETGMYYNTAFRQSGTITAKNSAFPWTTGTVTATATGRGLAASTLQRKGYDNRTPTGQGTIQLVTPLLTHWLHPTFSNIDTAGIAILRISFGPDTDGDGVIDLIDECQDSDLAATVKIDSCDSGVSNTLLAGGCTISDRIQECDDDAKNHGAFRRCVSKLGDRLQREGVLTGPEKDRILSCAGQKGRRGGGRGR